MANLTTPNSFGPAEPTGTEACGYAELIPVTAGVSACRDFSSVTVAAISKPKPFDRLTVYDQLSRDDAVETDFILHDSIKGWNATSGRVLELLASKARPEVTLHLLQLHESGFGGIGPIANDAETALVVSRFCFF
jgi:hypothetical protein